MARTVLITGATGTLGRKVVGTATAAGHHVRAMSRRSHVGYTGVHWAQGDLLADAGIDAAVDRRGRDRALRHASHRRQGRHLDAEPHRRRATRRRRHIVHVSIVGIDQIPLPYYRTKLRVEQALEASGVGHTVLRATQFHDLINTIFSIQRFSPCCGRCAECGSSPSTPATSRRGSSNWSTSNRRAGSPTSADPRCTRTQSWLGCTSRRAPAVARSSRSPCRGASLPVTVGREPGARQPRRYYRLCRLPRSRRIKFARLYASPGPMRAQFGQPPCMCQRSS